MDPLYALARPWLFRMDAEDAHRAILRWAGRASRSRAALAMTRAYYRPARDPILECNVFGRRFANPLGLAAGLAKDGDAIDLWAALGFAFVELGTFTPGDGQLGHGPPRWVRPHAQ